MQQTELSGGRSKLLHGVGSSSRARFISMDSYFILIILILIFIFAFIITFLFDISLIVGIAIAIATTSVPALGTFDGVVAHAFLILAPIRDLDYEYQRAEHAPEDDYGLSCHLPPAKAKKACVCGVAQLRSSHLRCVT